MSRLAWVLLLAATVALLAVVAAGAFLIGGKDSEPTEQQPPSASGPFALPLAESPSALAVAKHEGNLLVGVAARPGGPVEVAALRAEDAVPTENLRFQLDGQAVEAASCGTGCSRIDAPVLSGSRSRLSVNQGSSTLTFDLPAALPPPGTSLFDRAQKTMAGLRSFRYLERLSSGGATVVTRYKVEAPNRLQLRTASGFETVIIGRDRWDYHGGRWDHTPFPGLTVKKVLMWFQAKNARVVGRKDGVTELAAFGLEPVPAWFRLEVEPSGRVADAKMIAPSHFMVHRYGDFDGNLSIEAPQK